MSYLLCYGQAMSHTASNRQPTVVISVWRYQHEDVALVSRIALDRYKVHVQMLLMFSRSSVPSSQSLEYTQAFRGTDQLATKFLLIPQVAFRMRLSVLLTAGLSLVLVLGFSFNGIEASKGRNLNRRVSGKGLL